MTGGSGFVGSNIIRHMYQSYQIYNLGTSEVKHADSINFSTYESADIVKIVKDVKPDIVMHLGWAGVLGSDRNSVEQLKNINFAHRLVTACLLNDVKHFIGMGSQAEYGPKQGKISITEECNPTTLYGVCKLATYQMLQLMTESSNTKFSWIRLFSGYGPGENKDWIIPSIISAMARGETLPVTKGEQLWDFIHAEDIATAMKVICDYGAEGLFNLGSGTTIKLSDLFLFIETNLDNGGMFDIGALPYRPDQVMHLEADIKELKELGWTPTKKLKTEVMKTIEKKKEKYENL